MKIRYLLLIALLALASHAGATVLTFDIAGASNGQDMPQTYGDRVTSPTDGTFSYGSAGGFTPNVLLEYFSPDPPINLTFWSTGFSDLTNVLNNEPDGEAGYTVRFTADPGFLVRLDSFDLGNFGGMVTLPGLRIEDGDGNVLFSMTNFSVADSSQPHMDFDFAAGLSATELDIIVDTTGLGGNTDNIGLDNIQFGQDVVPEPSTFLLASIGAVALVAYLRRKQRVV